MARCVGAPVGSSRRETTLGMINDIMKALDKWEVWRDVQALPAKQIALEKRVVELESLLAGNAPADYCRHCGERAARYQRTIGSAGGRMEVWKCEECSGIDKRT
jgi:hypothetical protein